LTYLVEGKGRELHNDGCRDALAWGKSRELRVLPARRRTSNITPRSARCQCCVPSRLVRHPHMRCLHELVKSGLPDQDVAWCLPSLAQQRGKYMNVIPLI